MGFLKDFVSIRDLRRTQKNDINANSVITKKTSQSVKRPTWSYDKVLLS